MIFQLEELRKKIDRTDFEILSLLKKRIQLGLMTKKFKASITDSGREREILDNVKKQALRLGLIEPEFVARIYELQIEENKKFQEKGHRLAGFQGEHGAYSEVAALMFDREVVTVPCPGFSDVFENVNEGYLDIGVVPVENSLGGAITNVNELLIDTSLKVTGEIKLPIHHCLLVVPGTDYRNVKMVYSHPQALSQCRSFLNRNKLEARAFYDTAGAARMLSDDRPEAAAVIASKRCAELYNLEIIKENISDHSENYTRFLVLALNGDEAGKTKCSIIFSVEHKAGALFDILQLFAEARINLTRIESMPRRDMPGNYFFFMDFEGNSRDKKVQDILDKVKSKAARYKFLGNYDEVKI
ncbi:MAG: prephenate dehydratase [Oligoflexia bacterium]|nr:prephenate dehydratase [Oligoflexia bacterium]